MHHNEFLMIPQVWLSTLNSHPENSLWAKFSLRITKLKSLLINTADIEIFQMKLKLSLFIAE